jgi:tRNA (guanine-N7-)-methyltransferase
MTKRKLERFAENLTFPNMFQLTYEELGQGFVWKGKWKEFFRNENPIILEVGCGKGEYTVNLAERYPDKNYIGIDIKGARMWRGCKTSREKGLENVAFIRTYTQLLEQYFDKQEVSEIWITFPDPQPRKAREKRRLTHPRFLNIYGQLLIPDGSIHLKTDNSAFFDYTLSVLEDLHYSVLYSSHDLYHSPDAPPETTSIQTFYEKIFLYEGKPICYMKFKMRSL